LQGHGICRAFFLGAALSLNLYLQTETPDAPDRPGSSPAPTQDLAATCRAIPDRSGRRFFFAFVPANAPACCSEESLSDFKLARDFLTMTSVHCASRESFRAQNIFSTISANDTQEFF